MNSIILEKKEEKRYYGLEQFGTKRSHAILGWWRVKLMKRIKLGISL